MELTAAHETMPAWVTEGLIEGNPDVEFVDALIDDLGILLCIDTNQVYATGLSMGGGFVFALACTLADRFAGFAAASPWLVDDMGECQPARPVPMMGLHSIDDPTNPYDGDEQFGAVIWSFPQFGALWSDLNRCESGPDPGERSGEATSEVWTGCEAPVVMWSLADGGHSWPGSPKEGWASKDLDASQTVWLFFSQQTPA